MHLHKIFLLFEFMNENQSNQNNLFLLIPSQQINSSNIKNEENYQISIIYFLFELFNENFE